jgi:type III secretory pathway component EscR
MVNKSTDEIKNNTPKTTKRYRIKYSKQAERVRFKFFCDIIRQNIETLKQNNLTKDEPKSKTSKFSYNKRP